jgi:phage/plasmid-associated DNA primase
MELYKINTYANANKKFINENGIKVQNINDMTKLLKSDCGYHFRIHSKTQYILFGDIDHYTGGIMKFVNKMQKFMKKRYNVLFKIDDFKYTQNNQNKNSFHYSIPKFNASTEKLREIHDAFIDEYGDKMKYKTKDGIMKNCVDTSIYSEHWFRCPNQKKGTSINDTSMHKIVNGKMKNFVIMHIPTKSININNLKIVDSNVVVEKKKIVDDEIIECNEKLTKKNSGELVSHSNNNTNVTLLSTPQPAIYKKMFDECYKQERFENYNYWISIAMALKNTFDDDDEAFELFNYYSAKGSNYGGTDMTRRKFQTFVKREKKNHTVATIYYYAIEDNKPKFIEIMDKSASFDLEEYDMCKYVKLLEGKNFMYVTHNGTNKLFCFNGKIWEQNSALLKNFLSTDLYDFLKKILVELYFDDKSFNQMKSQIRKLKSTIFKENIVKTYRELGSNNQVKFDSNCDLLGFDNVVYDLKNGVFRDYKYDDYILTTTGYNWQEPTQDEIDTLTKLIEQIMPNKEERNLYLQILCSTLDGRCVEKFIIFNGEGGNGKGMMDDLLLCALGNHGLIANNSILFEINKTGSNPEKANIHKKRLVIFREPPEKHKFSNSTVKELTGGGMFSARGHHEKETQKELNLTMIVECNKKPLFAEEPTNAEVRRIIDVYFQSKFTTNKDQLDPKKHVYFAEAAFKETAFQEKHKFALIHILLNEYKKFRQNGFKFDVPQSVADRTQNYLELSCNLVTWFKQNYEFTGNKQDICRSTELYHNLSQSDYFYQLTKHEKQKYNKSYLKNYLETNIFFRKYFVEKTPYARNFICEWKLIKHEKNEQDDENN